MKAPQALFSYRPYWAKRFGTAPFLPMSREEMDALGWDSCDVIVVTGDAYIDHPSFGMALIGRLLEAQGFRVGIIAQPDWHSAEAFRALGQPNLYFGVTAGNMDSMVNRYTSERKIRSDDAYTPNGEGNKRPDRAVLVYSQRCREAYPDAPVVIGGIEASLRRIAHYDYWSDTVRRSVLPDAKADMLLFGNAERALVELTHRLANGEKIGDITDLRGTAFMRPRHWFPGDEWRELDSSEVDDTPPSPAGGGGAGGEGRRDGEAVSAPAGGGGAGGEGRRDGEAVSAAAGGGGAGGEGKTRQIAKPLQVDILAFARELRTHQTDAEGLLWEVLRAKRFFGLKFRRQHSVGRYILDFYCPEKKLNIELDGGQHAEQQAYDTERTKCLEQEGIRVLRFWNNEVLQETEAVLEAIRLAVGMEFPGAAETASPSRLPSPLTPPPFTGEGNLPPSPAGGRGVGGEGNIPDRQHTVVRLPSYEQVKADPLLYAHASRLLHLESNPGNARALVQAHGDRDVWVNPPPIPLETEELDRVYELPFARRPHPAYGEAKIPAWDMIRFSVAIMRGCFGGCTFCSITEHEGRIIQSRSEASVLREIEEVRDKTAGFTGVISDLGGPTANMYRLKCKDEKIESACRRLSCVYPDVCVNMGTDHGPLVSLYRKARALRGIKKVLIGSGVRYDLAVRSKEYVRELAAHHVGGYLKIAPEHTEPGPLSKMMKPGIDTYYRFKELFDAYSREAGKEQYLIPYFIAAHPGTTDEDMLNLALWLKANDFRPDQVQTFLPTPMALATTMYHSHRNPLKRVTRKGEEVAVPSGGRQRKLHKAFLRYHDPANWPLLRDALKKMGRADLIGNAKKCLVPAWQPGGTDRGKEEKKPEPRKSDARPVKGPGIAKKAQGRKR